MRINIIIFVCLFFINCSFFNLIEKDKIDFINNYLKNDIVLYNSDIHLDEVYIGKINLSYYNDVEYKNLVKSTLPSVVKINTDNGHGTGIILDDNHILTCAHVIEDREKIYVQFYDSTSAKVDSKNLIRADIVSIDITKDIAIISTVKDINNKKFPAMILSKVKSGIGQTVFSIAHVRYGWTHLKGSISNLIKNETIIKLGKKISGNFIMYQVPANLGASGSPLLDMDGNLLGITVFKRDNLDGLSFSIDINDIRDFINKYI